MRKIFLFLIGIIFIDLVLALNVKIDIPKYFNLGDEVSFSYTFTGNEEKITYVPTINCPNAPHTLLEKKDIVLRSYYSGSYRGFIVDDSIEPQKCTAYIQILEPYEQSFSKSFLINTKPSFSFSLKICKDLLCNERKSVFVKNQRVYFNYDSSISGTNIQSILTKPDGTKININIPDSIIAEQIGTYKLELISSKEGYKTIKVERQFGVIEQEFQSALPFSSPSPSSSPYSMTAMAINLEDSFSISILSLVLISILGITILFVLGKILYNNCSISK